MATPPGPSSSTVTLAALEPMSVTSAADRLAAGFLRERLEAQLAWHQLNEPLRLVRAPIGLISAVRDSVDLLPRDGDDAWRNIAARLAAIPVMFTSWRASLDAGLAQGLTAARRQAVQAAVAADHCVGSHDSLVASYGDGPLAAELAAAVAQAYQGYAEIARYLREDYAPRATEVDAVGVERYAVAARLNLGADIDLKEAYEWGWAELARIEAEMTAEANAIRPGASVDEATAILNESAYVDLARTRTWPGCRTGTTGPSSSLTACTSTSPLRCAGSRWSWPAVRPPEPPTTPGPAKT